MPRLDRDALRRTFLAALATTGASCTDTEPPRYPERLHYMALRASPPQGPIDAELGDTLRKEGATFRSVDLRTPGAFRVEILNVTDGRRLDGTLLCDTEPCAMESLRFNRAELIDRALVVRDGTKVRRVWEHEFAEAFGVVDSPEKAAARVAIQFDRVGLGRCADLTAYGAQCAEGSKEDGVPVRSTEDGGYDVVVYGEVNVCENNDHGNAMALATVHVAKDGAVSWGDDPFAKAAATIVRVGENTRCQGMMLGRMFEGYVDVPAAEELSAYLARAARQEAAAVHAFERLAGELASLGAPATLTAAARQGAEDERRHARRFEEALASIEGGRGESHVIDRAEPPERWRARSLFEVLVENAVEGCANESYAALVATHQADADAGAPAALRPLFSEIAEDERAHAALAFEIHRWGRALLDEHERRALDAALASALLSIATCQPTALGRALGEPRPEVARPAFDAVVRALQA